MNPKLKKTLQWLGKEILSFVLNQVFSFYGLIGTVLLTVAIFWHYLSNMALTIWQSPPSQWTIKEIMPVIIFATIAFLLVPLLWKAIYKKWIKPKQKYQNIVPTNKDELINLKSPKQIEKELQEYRIRLLKNLSGDEKSVLKLYFEKDTKSQRFHVTNGLVMGLVSKGILFCPTDVMIMHELAYNISEWAWEYLRNHSKLLE